MVAPTRLVFAGTPDFAVPHLAACLAQNVDIAAVYTQPDRPAGRGRKLSLSPVKQAALASGLRVEQPQTLRDPEAQALLRELAPDLIVVVAYGLILPRKVLAIPQHGCWNVHASLLPRWRGAAPIQSALLAGDARTGVCLMQMQAGLDTGPVMLERAIAIADDDTGGTLHDKLAGLGAQILSEGLARAIRGEPMPARAQPEQGATYAHKIEKAQAQLDFNEPASVLERKVRAFDPWPVAQAEIAGESLRVWGARALPGAAMKASGTLLAANREGLDIACGDGVLRLLEVQRAGGRRIPVRDYLNARPELRTGNP